MRIMLKRALKLDKSLYCSYIKLTIYQHMVDPSVLQNLYFYNSLGYQFDW